MPSRDAPSRMRCSTEQPSSSRWASTDRHARRMVLRVLQQAVRRVRERDTFEMPEGRRSGSGSIARFIALRLVDFSTASRDRRPPMVGFRATLRANGGFRSLETHFSSSLDSAALTEHRPPSIGSTGSFASKELQLCSQREPVLAVEGLFLFLFEVKGGFKLICFSQQGELEQGAFGL